MHHPRRADAPWKPAPRPASKVARRTGLRAARRLLPALLVLAGCDAAADDVGAGLADAGPRPDAEQTCPQDGVRGPGRHRLFVQGAQAEASADGSYPFLHEWRADGSDAELCDDAVFANDTNGDHMWEPGESPRPLGPHALVHGEHFLVGTGAFAEFRIALCDDIDGEVVFYIPNFDQAGSQALHQLFVVHEGVEQLVAEAVDDEAGQSGYNPFVRVLHGADPVARRGDTLLLRSTNLNGVAFSVMVWRPPSEYESWISVHVP